MKNTRWTLGVGGALWLLSTTASAHIAATCHLPSPGEGNPGGQIFLSSDATVHGQYCGTEASFTNEIELSSPRFQLIATGHVTPEGTEFDLGMFTSGTELIFAIHVVNTGDTFFSGPGTRNPDGVVHATVVDLGENNLLIGFEDLFGGGDFDYNDIAIVTHIEPSANAPCPCNGNWENHGAYVSCVARSSNAALDAGLITDAEKGAIQSAAARSQCGK